jgi:beta-glucosidase
MSFPENFTWGASTASYQIEGAAFEDSKGLSVWDMMSRWNGKIWMGNTGDISCDHYHRYKEDVKLMGNIGLKGYRFSISWPRVIPEGIGKINSKGLEFYDKLVDELLENKIEPWITLFHWDFPYKLFLKGGWLNRDSSDWFAEYTSVIVNKLSDRVTYWMTQNEPQCYLGLGHQDGMHAPGLKMDFPEILLICHNSLLAHGKAVQAIRSQSKKKSIIGAAPVGVTKIPATNDRRDIDLARSLMFSINEKSCWNNTWFADPMIFGKYPEDGLKLFEKELPEIKDGDLKTINQPLDFYGTNVYFSDVIKYDAEKGYKVVEGEFGETRTTMDWPITPESLYWGPKFLYERYKLPIVITENGMANIDWINLDGKVHDPQRIDYIHRYLKEYKRAIDDGVKSLGYFVWSIIDNFEWAFGFKQKFGLIYVDMKTQKRILKDSAYWYKEIIKTNGNGI